MCRYENLYFAASVENLSSVILIRAETNWAVQPQEMARGLEFRIK